jgi:DNA-binding NarL/FixJ family response regulator
MARKLLRKLWTPTETSLLAKLLRDGEDVHHIARKMKRSASSVRLQKRKLAHSQKRSSGERG